MTWLRHAGVATALLVAGCGSGGSTSSASSLLSMCQQIGQDEVAAIIGDTDLETFSIDRLDECVWTSTSHAGRSITLRIEDAPSGPLFIEHAIEATDPERVQPLDIGADAVLFVDEAVLGRIGDQVVLVTGELATEQLVPTLEAALSLLSDP